jgi:hypothetical protein
MSNTITFSAAHGVTKVLPNVARLQVTGSTACDGYYYMITVLSPTAMTVVLAATTFSTGSSGSASINGGTITYQNGDTDTLRPTSSVYASGSNYCNGVGGDSMRKYDRAQRHFEHSFASSRANIYHLRNNWDRLVIGKFCDVVLRV